MTKAIEAAREIDAQMKTTKGFQLDWLWPRAVTCARALLASSPASPDVREALEMCRQAAMAKASDPTTRFEAIIQFVDAALSPPPVQDGMRETEEQDIAGRLREFARLWFDERGTADLLLREGAAEIIRLRLELERALSARPDISKEEK